MYVQYYSSDHIRTYFYALSVQRLDLNTDNRYFTAWYETSFMEEFRTEAVFSGDSEDDSPSRKRKRAEMFCSHCNKWVSKSKYYRHRRDYGGIDDGVKKTDLEEKSEAFAAVEEGEMETDREVLSATEQFESDDGDQSMSLMYELY